MIIPNGTIEFISIVGGGLDANGYPKAETDSYGCPIECQYVANNHSYLGKSEGESFISASYSILVENLCPIHRTERLRLKDRFGNVVKECSVLEFEPLDAVCQTRITVK